MALLTRVYLFFPYVGTTVVGMIGVWGGTYVNMPLPFMLGPIVAFLLLSGFLSVPGVVSAFLQKNFFIAVPHKLLGYAIIMVGVYVGARFDPVVLERVELILPLILFLLIAIMVGGGISYILLRWSKMPPAEALACSAPGAFSLIILYLSKSSIRLDRVTLVHSIRIMIVLILTPIYFQYLLGEEPLAFQELPGELAVVLPRFTLMDGVVLFGSAIPIAWAADRWIPVQGSGFIVVSFWAAFLYAQKVIIASPPEWLFNAILFAIALAIASRMINFRWSRIGKDLFRGVMLVCVLLLVSAGCASLLHVLTGYDLTTALLAFIPGGLHEISLIAIVYDRDPIIIAFIHWLRVVLVAGFFPVVLGFVYTPEKDVGKM